MLLNGEMMAKKCKLGYKRIKGRCKPTTKNIKVKGHWRRKPKGKHPKQYTWIKGHTRKR